MAIGKISTPEQSSNKGVLIGLVILVVLSGSGFGWSFYKYYQTKKQLAIASSPEIQKEMAKKESDALIAKVKRLMVLPENEEPVVATVTDKDALSKEQPFYQDAHNGDRVIAYMAARKAIIYDPVNDKIVNAGPIYVQNNASTTPAK
ncbi:MAG: hypothetical protein WCG01_05085 [bacterium]